MAIRVAQGPGETLGDRVSTHRGMAIKVFGVEGEKLHGHDAPTQDFVFATGRTFPPGIAQGGMRDLKDCRRQLNKRHGNGREHERIEIDHIARNVERDVLATAVFQLRQPRYKAFCNQAGVLDVLAQPHDLTMDLHRAPSQAG